MFAMQYVSKKCARERAPVSAAVASASSACCRFAFGKVVVAAVASVHALVIAPNTQLTKG